MKYKLKDMIAKGIKHVVIDGHTLLYADEVKKNYPDTKVDPANVSIMSFDDKEIKLVRPEHIEEMTEFDKNIVKTLNFNPNKKPSS